VLTAASFVLALGAIVSAELGEFERAAWFIVWCVLLDLADGVVARLLKATSSFGAAFDSLADVVAFGLAPAALVLHFLWQTYPGIATGWIALACGLYALLAALRLARFNSVAPVEAGWFRGLPTTACGALLATGILLLVRDDALLAWHWPVYLPVALTALGLLMVSTLRFPKPALARHRLVNIPHVANIVALYICGTLRIWPQYLFAVAVLVVVLGLLAGVRRRPPA
jgi:CDP-diacylglycerol--serine O-phosphatidyltransferase